MRDWIAQGAAFKEHWAYLTPELPLLPTVKRKSWPRNEIDYFILARREQAGLKPSPEAEKHTLLRRVTLSLTGLPPTIAEVDASIGDLQPDWSAEVTAVHTKRRSDNTTPGFSTAASELHCCPGYEINHAGVRHSLRPDGDRYRVRHAPRSQSCPNRLALLPQCSETIPTLLSHGITKWNDASKTVNKFYLTVQRTVG